MDVTSPGWLGTLPLGLPPTQTAQTRLTAEGSRGTKTAHLLALTGMETSGLDMTGEGRPRARTRGMESTAFQHGPRH
jgi:hypothetical protein